MIYLVLLILLLILWYISENRQYKVIYFVGISFFFMTLVIGLRGASVGEDTSSYLQIAQAAQEIPIVNIIKGFPLSAWKYSSYGIYGGYTSKIETGFLLYNKILMILFKSPQAVIFFTAAISNLLFSRFIIDNAKTRNQAYIGVIAFLCESMFFSEFNVIRQILAMSMALQTISSLKKKQTKRALAWLFFAWTVHQSVLIYLVLIPLILCKNKKRITKWVMGLVFILPFSLPVLKTVATIFFPTQYSTYLTTNIWGTSIRGTVLIWIFILVLVVLIFTSGVKTDEDYFLIWMMLIYFALEAMGISLTTIGRLAIYFRFFEILFFGTCIKYVEKKSRPAYILILFVLLFTEYYSYASSPERAYILFL